MTEYLGSDEEIIAVVLGGDVDAFEGIVRRYQDKVAALCAGLLGANHAEDAAQETFLKTYLALKDFRREAKFSTWLYRIAYNHCLNVLAERKRRRQESLDELLEKLGADLPPLNSAPDELKSLEAKQLVEKTFSELTVEEKTILTLREIQGLSYQEIAVALHISLDLVKVRIFRARQAFLRRAKSFL